MNDEEQDVAVFAAVIQAGREEIDERTRAGADVSAWEAFWLKLLREYELLCEELEHKA